MTRYPTVLCPIDFSDASKAALCYATAVADHFGARLVIVAVDDPLLVQAAATTGQVPSLTADTENELRRVCGRVLDRLGPGARSVEYRVGVGKPAPEILRLAVDAGADLIVMSSHGRSGVRKLFFGSTTERVLRETSIPVLITPDQREHQVSLSDVGRHLHRVLAPVDLTDASLHQAQIAAGVATALSVPLILAHVLEPVFVPVSVRLVMPGVDAMRFEDARERLGALAQSVVTGPGVETLVVTGEPSEEIVRLAQTREAHLIVIGLHSSGLLGPRMGSVTYRVLCLTHALVLALPPVLDHTRDEHAGRSMHSVA
ncbi:MAG TPA: universal stress protein [Vicinamibacterales bacterium]|nr:universal stress protein [Vicinamibacterales bacterium]